MSEKKEKQGSLFPELPSPIVAKSNEIIRASWPTKHVLEMRLIAHIASKIHKDDEDFAKYSIHFSELFDKDKKYGGKDIKEIKTAMIGLQNRFIEIENKATGRFRRYPLFSMLDIDPKNSVLTVRFDSDLKPHFLNFRDRLNAFDGFTQYKYLEFMKLPSVYSQKIFEYLMSYKKLPEVTIDVVKLYEYLGVSESYKKDFGNFRVRVLEQAHGDIKRFTSLRYTWTPQHSGRRVVAIRFVFTGKRIAESDAEEAIAISTRAAGKAEKLHKARLEAFKCLHEKKRVCDSLDRARHVCAVCKKEYWKDYQVNAARPVEIESVAGIEPDDKQERRDEAGA